MNIWACQIKLFLDDLAALYLCEQLAVLDYDGLSEFRAFQTKPNLEEVMNIVGEKAKGKPNPTWKSLTGWVELTGGTRWLGGDKLTEGTFNKADMYGGKINGDTNQQQPSTGRK